jgi:hypothetical protein
LTSLRAAPTIAPVGSAALDAPRRAETRAAEISVEPDGLVLIRIKEGLDLEAEHMREVLEARFALAPSAAPVLVDARRVRSMTREAQEISAAPDVRPFTARLAVLVGSPVSVVLGNFFMVIVRPPYPTRLFRDEARARAWLLDRWSHRG